MHRFAGLCHDAGFICCMLSSVNIFIPAALLHSMVWIAGASIIHGMGINIFDVIAGWCGVLLAICTYWFYWFWFACCRRIKMTAQHTWLGLSLLVLRCKCVFFAYYGTQIMSFSDVNQAYYRFVAYSQATRRRKSKEKSAIECAFSVRCYRVCFSASYEILLRLTCWWQAGAHLNSGWRLRCGRTWSSLLLLFAVLGVLECVPLGDRTTRRGQHVRPVAQFSALCTVAQDDLPDRFGCTDTIVINDCDYKVHFLHGVNRVGKCQKWQEMSRISKSNNGVYNTSTYDTQKKLKLSTTTKVG